jgi:SAM-dependent methyltransferase
LELFKREALPRMGSRRRALALGVPDIGATLDDLKLMFGPELTEASYHALMKQLGFGQVMSLDVSSYEGCELVQDLNRPLTIRTGKFDLIVDNGTIEHCFCAAQAFFNVKRLCALGGVVFHNNPANWFGHGFWNFSPCVYFDFYRANGFDVHVYLRDVAAGTYKELEYHPKVTSVLEAKRFVIHAVATKYADVPDTVPTQHRFAMLHSAAESVVSGQKTRATTTPGGWLDLAEVVPGYRSLAAAVGRSRSFVTNLVGPRRRV